MTVKRNKTNFRERKDVLGETKTVKGKDDGKSKST